MLKKSRPLPIYTELIASPEDFTPLSKDMKIIGAFNPGVATIESPNGLETLLMVRVAETPREQPKNHVILPFFKIYNKDSQNLELDFDIIPKRKIKEETKKEVGLSDEVSRLKHISLPRIIIINENKKIIYKGQKQILSPCYEYERFGKEDLRITHIEKEGYYLITSVSPHRDFGVSTDFITTKDFKNFERLPKGDTPRPIITATKDVSVFPEKVKSTFEKDKYGKEKMVYAALIRPNAFPDLSIPGIWLSYSPDLIYWGNAHRLTTNQKGKITGTGTPLIKLDDMWFGAFHEIHLSDNKRTYTAYRTKLIGLDLNNPWEVKYISKILRKRKDYPDIPVGYVPNVVYTSGLTKKDEIISLFSGIDDTYTVRDDFYKEDLVKFLKQDSSM